MTGAIRNTHVGLPNLTLYKIPIMLASEDEETITLTELNGKENRMRLGLYLKDIFLSLFEPHYTHQNVGITSI